MPVLSIFILWFGKAEICPIFDLGRFYRSFGCNISVVPLGVLTGILVDSYQWFHRQPQKFWTTQRPG